MPSIYDFRHVELDKVGRGKRIIKAPGGGAHNIFGHSSDNPQPMNGNGKANGNGSISETESVDGSVLSCPSTPIHNGNGNGSQFGYESDTSSTPSSTTSSRRGSLQDTKNRLFGQPEGLESPRRRVVDRMKSNIFAEPEPAPVVRSPSVKKYEHVIRRNPITGEVLEEQQQQQQQQQQQHSTSNGNGNAIVNMNGSMNGMYDDCLIIIINNFFSIEYQGSNGSASMPNTPVRIRQPPGGKTSNIFG
ncbi:uncharacterized protein LOC124499967 isoform X1 [Dermatophagoides farinae]|uniref:uncharacterized protein LOC124499967 isoform X1 n=1 Tax=Dermatophagoides farinae TaxID=6954 RepID=UPI003F62416D